MPVEDVFHLRQGRAVMVTGLVERGRVRKGDTVELVGPGGGATARVEDVEQSQVRVAEAGAGAGMNVGLLLGALPADAYRRGQVLVTPGSMSARAGFTADISVLSEEQGGADVVSGDRLCFYVRTAAVWGTVTLPEGSAMVRPLHGAEVTVTLDAPVALETGGPFTFRHHGRASGTGSVTRLLR